MRYERWLCLDFGLGFRAVRLVRTHCWWRKKWDCGNLPGLRPSQDWRQMVRVQAENPFIRTVHNLWIASKFLLSGTQPDSTKRLRLGFFLFLIGVYSHPSKSIVGLLVEPSSLYKKKTRRSWFQSGQLSVYTILLSLLPEKTRNFLPSILYLKPAKHSRKSKVFWVIARGMFIWDP